MLAVDGEMGAGERLIDGRMGTTVGRERDGWEGIDG